MAERLFAASSSRSSGGRVGAYHHARGARAGGAGPAAGEIPEDTLRLYAGASAIRARRSTAFFPVSSQEGPLRIFCVIDGRDAAHAGDSGPRSDGFSKRNL